MMEESERVGKVASFKVMDVLKRANELGPGVVHCEVGQPETGAPKTVAQAAVTALQEPRVMGYTDAFGLLPLRHKIAAYYEKKHGVLPDVSNIVVTTGSSGGFLLAFTACFDANDVVAIASSGYPCYRNILLALGCKLCHVPIHPTTFQLTATELAKAIQQRRDEGLPPIKGLILSSPSNPTGAMLEPNQLEELCQLCDANNIRFLSDEIYHGITYGNKQEATALQYSKTTVIINSFSKYYSMSGWRLGWMVVPPDLVDAMNKLQQNMFINAPTISQTAALECWEDSTIAELEGHVSKYRASRALLLEQLKDILPDTAKLAPADGGFYIYVDMGAPSVCLEHGLGSAALCASFLEEEHVAFTPGIDFEDPAGHLGEMRFRISYAGGIDTSRQAMTRLARFWPKWQARITQAKQE